MKNKKIWFIVMAIAVVLLTLALLKHSFMMSIFYGNSDILTSEENAFVKQAVLQEIKKNHSVFADNQPYGKGIFIVVDDFMQPMTETKDGTYELQVQLKAPDDWKYYFTFEKIDSKMTLVKCEIDP